MLSDEEKKRRVRSRILLGWREWVALPELGIPSIKAKLDTGARTSSLHAFRIESFTKSGVQMVRFSVHPLQRDTSEEQVCVAAVVDRRWVSDSGGHREKRYVIRTPVRIGPLEWAIEISLSGRDNMQFRMLLGRTALHRRIMVDPTSSYLSGRPELDKNLYQAQEVRRDELKGEG